MKTKISKKIIVLLIAAVVCAIVGISLTVIPEIRFRQNMSIGEKYLDDSNFK